MFDVPGDHRDIALNPLFIENSLPLRELIVHREAMSSTGGEIGSTLTGGIQDVAAILPCSAQSNVRSK